MPDEPDRHADIRQPPTYLIRVEGHLGCEWADWFDGLTIGLEEDGTTLLCGPIADQAALHGVLRRIRDLGMPLVSVDRAADQKVHHPRSDKEYRDEHEQQR